MSRVWAEDRERTLGVRGLGACALGGLRASGCWYHWCWRCWACHLSSGRVVVLVSLREPLRRVVGQRGHSGPLFFVVVVVNRLSRYLKGQAL